MPNGWFGWRRFQGSWPGRGPFSHLPPWERPGWLYGRGACWWLFGPRGYPPIPAPYGYDIPTTAPAPTGYPWAPATPAISKEQELAWLEEMLKALEQELEQIKKRLAELRK